MQQPNLRPQPNNYSRRTNAQQQQPSFMRTIRRGGGGHGRGIAQQQIAFVPRAPPPCVVRPHGRGQWVNWNSDQQNRSDQHKAERDRGCYRKTQRPLVPENWAELSKWEYPVMSPGDLNDIAKQCIGVVDESIRLDNYRDRNTLFNSSNHVRLIRQEQEQRMRQQHMYAQSNVYEELIAQCEANPGMFPGTRFCLNQVLGDEQLAEFIRHRAWTDAELEKWEIRKNWQVHGKELAVSSNDSSSYAQPPVFYGTSTGAGKEEVVQKKMQKKEEDHHLNFEDSNKKFDADLPAEKVRLPMYPWL